MKARNTLRWPNRLRNKRLLSLSNSNLYTTLWFTFRCYHSIKTKYNSNKNQWWDLIAKLSQKNQFLQNNKSRRKRKVNAIIIMMSNTSSIDNCKPWLMEKTFALLAAKKLITLQFEARFFEICFHSFIILNNREHSSACRNNVEDFCLNHQKLESVICYNKSE